MLSEPPSLVGAGSGMGMGAGMGMQMAGVPVQKAAAIDIASA